MVINKANLPLPDQSLHPVGGASADVVGPMQLNLLKHFGLRADDSILDLGCGIGRLAYVMADYLDNGQYMGLDISRKAIDWLNKNYNSVLSNFNFELLDVNNKRYNPKGSIDPSNVTLPFTDNSFDKLCAYSVFTHMRIRDIECYLSEIARILKPSGIAVLTFFSIDTERDKNPMYGKIPFLPIPDSPKTWTLNLETPERGIAFASDRVDEIIRGANLRMVERIDGYWRGNKKNEEPYIWAHQDVYAVTPQPVKQ